MRQSTIVICAAGLLAGGFLMAWQQGGGKLPPPFHTPSAANPPKVIPQPDGIQLQVPAGFTVNEFASGFKKPRVLLTAPNGEVLVADSVAKGGVYVLADRDGDGRADAAMRPLIEGLDRPYGMAFWKDFLYVAEPTSLKRYKFDAKSVSAGAAEELLSFPADFVKGHWTRAIAFDPKGTKFYLNIGSGSNITPDEDERRATILECDPAAKSCSIYATGVRNATGLGFNPQRGELWATVQERDGLGDDLTPDFFTHVQKGGFYGWPWAYWGPNEEPRNAGKRPDLVAKSIVPDVNVGSHTAVMDFRFYTGKLFPARYRNGAFLAFRGSSNRAQRVGYSVGFVPFGKDGRPAGAVEPFLTGWMLGPDKKEVWGRPIGISMLKDGSLVISEDAGNRIWRVGYGR